MNALPLIFADILAAHTRIPVHMASSADQALLQSIADAVKARRAARRPSPARATPAPRKSQAELLAELQIEQQGFDPAYPWSDDYGFWAYQANKDGRINDLRRQLAEAA